jgi:tetratricopeptide (TPR) repeat protein/tRNA A-37 threonylcarbamoyl transferase component Bud32
MPALACPICHAELLSETPGGGEARCPSCGAALPPEGQETRYGGAQRPPPILEPDATRYADRPITDETNYQTPPPGGEPDATRYSPPRDPDATGYTPTPSGDGASPSGLLPRCFASYELLGELGRGGMGVVYKARQTSPDRLVALKMIRAGELATEADVRRFRREANEAAGLDHPAIVPIYEVGEHHGRHFYSMKLIEGGSLAAQLDRYPGDPRTAARLVAMVARAVHHAHQHQLLHRDLKPGNVLIDAEGRPYVADFGLAKRLGGQGDASQSVGAGTPEYMAPEQARGGDRLTTAADVYALGGILYALLAGRPPFRGDSPWATISQVLSQPPAPPSRHRPGCPRDLETVCLKCLDKDPARRYGSAEALAEELERWLKGEPVLARPVGGLRRAWRWARRNPALACTLAALAAVVLGSLAGMTALYLHAERQRRVAERRGAEARTVTRFYEDHVLSAARPKGWEGGMGKDVTLKQALDHAGRAVEEAFAGQPEQEATVRNTLGMTYWYQGEFDAAKPHLEKAYKIRRQWLGEDDPDTLTSLHNLAMLRWKQGQDGEAVALFRQALEGRRRVLGPEHEDTLWTQLNLGMLWSNSQLDEGEALLRPAIESCKGTLGPNHHHTLYGQHDLAIVLWKNGKDEDARALARQTLEARSGSLGPVHPDTLRTMCLLARILVELGELKEAETIYHQSLDGRRRVLGLEHIETLQGECYLADLLHRNGNYAQAEKLLRHGLGESRSSVYLLREHLMSRQGCLPPGDIRTAYARGLLGDCLAKQGKFAEGEPLLLASYEDLTRADGAPQKRIAQILDRVIELYEKWGKPEQAEAWRKKRPAPAAP